jgi:hypothetical protein
MCEHHPSMTDEMSDKKENVFVFNARMGVGTRNRKALSWCQETP